MTTKTEKTETKNSKLEKVSSVKRKLTIDVPVEKIAEAIEKAYVKIQKKAKMKGFREGKVPHNLLEIHFKEDAEHEALEDVVSRTYSDALKEQDLNPISRPEVVPSGPFSKDKPFSYTAEFEVHPEVEVKDYEGLTLEKTERTVTDEQVEKRLAAMRESMAQLEPAPEDATVQKGYIAFVDFNGTCEGKPFKGSKADNFLVDVGAGSLLPDFENQMMGMKKGESKKIELTYPTDYFNKELAGKHGAFDLTIKEIKVKKLPELNDDFAKDLGQFKTIEEVRADIKKRFESAVEHEAKNELSNHAMDLIIKNHQFEVPESLVNSELKEMFDGFVKQLSGQGKKFEDSGMTVEQFIDQYKPMAADRIRGYYILNAIAKAENLAITDADIDERLNSMAAQYNQPIEKIKDYYSKNNLLDNLKSQLLNEKTLDFVVSKAKIKAKKAKPTQKK